MSTLHRPAPPGAAPILLIDDDDSIAGPLRHYLLAQGCRVDTALDFSSAEALMKAESYRVIVVDPYLTGTHQEERSGFAGRIGILQPAARIIVLTGYGSESMEGNGLSKQIVATLPKPQPVLFLSHLVVATLRASAGG
jgi:two-component system, NtrC family, response regulator PilR